MNGSRELVLAAQRDHKVDDPGEQDVHRVGTLGSILQLLRLPDGTVKVLVEGKSRTRIKTFRQADPFLACEIELVPEVEDRSVELEALIRTIHSTFENYVKLNRKVPPEILNSIAQIQTPSKLADQIVGHLNLKLEDRQRLLELL